MIVYTGDTKRVNNYNTQKINFTSIDLELFEAVDTVNRFDEYKKTAIEEKMLDENYITEYLQNRKRHPNWGRKGPGALGCDMSHIMCYKEINEELDDGYCLLLEDDAILTSDFMDSLNEIVDQAQGLGSDYVHLCCNSRFKREQYNESNRVSRLLYKMVPQWHTTAQLISKRGMNTLIGKLPFAVPIDLAINNYITELNATSSIVGVKNGGCSECGDKESQLGSLIW